MQKLPRWADVALIPLINLIIAFAISAIVIFAIGENPWMALWTMIDGTFLRAEGWGYMLYYATNFMFTGLAVAVAFHASQFNIGGEGQATMGGLGVALVCLALPWPHWTIALIAATIGAAAFGAAWAAIPAWLQAKRGSHIVITTIMFNFIASSLMVYFINYWLRPVGKMAVESRAVGNFDFSTFDLTGAYIPSLRELSLAIFGYRLPSSPLNPTFLFALAVAWGVWYLLWRTKLGYEIRAVGANTDAAIYAGIRPQKIIMVTMAISGGLAGLVAVNEVLGAQHRLVLEYVQGAGFVGIAVALMGRSHPVGIVLAAMLFGLLYQGGTELSFAKPEINRDMIVVIQGLVILFMGALEQTFRPWLEALFFRAED